MYFSRSRCSRPANLETLNVRDRDRDMSCRDRDILYLAETETETYCILPRPRHTVSCRDRDILYLAETKTETCLAETEIETCLAEIETETCLAETETETYCILPRPRPRHTVSCRDRDKQLIYSIYSVLNMYCTAINEASGRTEHCEYLPL